VAAYLLESPWHRHRHQMEVRPILPANRTLPASTGEAQGQRAREDQCHLMVTSALHYPHLSVMIRTGSEVTVAAAVQALWMMALLVCQLRAYQVLETSWQRHLRVLRVLRMGSLAKQRGHLQYSPKRFWVRPEDARMNVSVSVYAR